MTTYIAQPNGYGCAIASLAMVAGYTYDEMEAWFISNGATRGRLEGGLHEGIWLEALGRLGFVYERRYIGDAISNGPRTTPWPPAPFAPIHICAAEVDVGSHAFVMLGDGSVLDPWKRERTTITHPDYIKVNQVAGVWPRPR